MTDAIQQDNQVIRAAGGLVWRETPHGPQLAVVHRARHAQEWTLTKGRVEEGESWLQGAAREAREETGYHVEVGAYAGALAYQVNGRPKVVCFWHMRVLGEAAPLDLAEISEVAWLSREAALARLSRPLEKAFLEVASLPVTAQETTPA